MITRFTFGANRRTPLGQWYFAHSNTNIPKRRYTNTPSTPNPSAFPSTPTPASPTPSPSSTSDPSSPIPPEELQRQLEELLRRSDQETANKMFSPLDPYVDKINQKVKEIEKALEGTGYTLEDVKEEYRNMDKEKSIKRQQLMLKKKLALKEKRKAAKAAAAPEVAQEGPAEPTTALAKGKQKKEKKEKPEAVEMCISKNLRSLLLNSTSKEFNSSVGEKILMWKNSLRIVPPGELRAVYLQNEIDTSLQMVLENEKGKGKEITCKKGCAFCCHRMVDVTSDEAFILTNKLEEMEGGTISEKTISELTMKANSFPSTIKGEKFQWKADYEVSKCIFLKNSECSVYNQRPVACRLMNVISDPQLCSKEASNPKEKSTRLISLLPEIIHSAAIDLDENHRAMPQALLSEIQKRKLNPTTTDQQVQSMVDYINEATTFKPIN